MSDNPHIRDLKAKAKVADFPVDHRLAVAGDVALLNWIGVTAEECDNVGFYLPVCCDDPTPAFNPEGSRGGALHCQACDTVWASVTTGGPT